MSDREVVVTYAIRAGSGNRGVFENIAKGAADIQNAYTRAGDTAARHAEQMAKRIETAYSRAAKSIAGSATQRITATASQFVMPLSPQQQAMARAQANGGTGVSQFLEDSPVFRQKREARTIDVAQERARRSRGSEQLADVEYVPGEPSKPMRRAIQVAEQPDAAAERAAQKAQAAQNKRTIDILKQQEREATNAERMAERKIKADERAAAIATRAAEKEARDKERASQRAAAAAERTAERVARAAEKQAKDQERASERAATAAERAAQREQKAQSKRTIDILRQQEREATDAERTAAKQAAKAEQQRERFSGGARKAFQGAVSAVEGVAYLGLSSEEDTQKLIEGVMKVRGAAMGLVGVVDVVDGVMRAMGAVRAISVAGTAAEVALTAARTRTAAATGAAAAAEGGGIAARLGGLLGLGSAVAGGAGGAGAGAAAGVGGIGVGAGVAGAGALLSVLAAGGMATNAFGVRDKTAGWMSGATRTVDDFGVKRKVSNVGEYGENRSVWESVGRWGEWSALTAVGAGTFSEAERGESRAKAATNETKRRESLASQQATRRTADQEYGTQITQIRREQRFMALDRSMRDVGEAAGRGITDPAQRELAEAQARRREFGKDDDKSRTELNQLRQQQVQFVASGKGESVKPEAIVEAEKTRLEYLRRGLEIRRQEYDAQKRVNDEAIAGAQRAIGILQQRKGIYAQQAEALRQEYRTGAEAWGTMDAGQRQLAKSLKERFDRGEDLRPEQEQELLNTPISAQMRERVRKRQRDRGEREGYREFAGGEIAERTAALDRTQAGIQRRIDVRQEVVVKIERDDNELLRKFRAEASQVEDQVAGLVAADMNRSLEALGVKIVQAMNQAFSHAGSQASAKVEAQAAQRGAAGAN